MKILARVTVILSCVWCTSAIAFAQDDFDKLRSEFQQKATTTLGPDSVQTSDSLSFYVSRKLLSNAVKLEFNKSDVRIAAAFPRQTLSPQPKPVDLTMPHIIKSCAPICFNCCDCGLFSPDCCLCDIGRAACIAAEAPVLAACQATKTILDLAAGAHLGSIEFKDVVAQASMDPSPLKIDIDDTLSNATINANLSVRGEIEGKADIHLETLVSVFTACFTIKPVDIPRTPIVITASSPTFQNKLDPVPSDDGISIQVTLQKTSLHLNFKVSPLLTIIANNPDLIVTCALPSGVILALEQLIKYLTLINP